MWYQCTKDTNLHSPAFFFLPPPTLCNYIFYMLETYGMHYIKSSYLISQRIINSHTISVSRNSFIIKILTADFLKLWFCKLVFFYMMSMINIHQYPFSVHIQDTQCWMSFWTSSSHSTFAFHWNTFNYSYFILLKHISNIYIKDVLLNKSFYKSKVL